MVCFLRRPAECFIQPSNRNLIIAAAIRLHWLRFFFGVVQRRDLSVHSHDTESSGRLARITMNGHCLALFIAKPRCSTTRTSRNGMSGADLLFVLQRSILSQDPTAAMNVRDLSEQTKITSPRPDGFRRSCGISKASHPQA